MGSNTFGKWFSITSFGESHGPAIGGVIDGCPAGLAVSESDIQLELNRRKPGQSSFTTQRQEPDSIQILSGLFEGKTTGAPIGFIIQNSDQRSHDYNNAKNWIRPGHADFTYLKKYGFYDYRGGGRASARETAIRVAAGAVAKKWLTEKHRIQIRAYVAQIGHVIIDKTQFSWEQVNQNPFFCPDETAIPAMVDLIQTLKVKGDSVGARINIEVHGTPAGWGDPIYEKLDANLAKALMSINAVKGVEIGDGFDVVTQKGSYHRDELTPNGFSSNHAGGILAGISTGQPLLMSIALKPPSGTLLSANSVDRQNQPVSVSMPGRHDPCVGIRAVPIAEAMVALVIIDHCLSAEAFNIKEAP